MAYPGISGDTGGGLGAYGGGMDSYGGGGVGGGFGGGGFGGGALGTPGTPGEFDPSPYCIPGKVKREDVMDMRRAFEMIDEDRSGEIDAEELISAAEALGMEMGENIAVLLGSQKLNFDQFFQKMTSELGPEDTCDEIVNIFELFDNDSTGTINLSNLENVANIIGAKESKKEIQEMLSTLDTDGDGEIDPMDFYTCLVSGMRLRMEDEARLLREEADQAAASADTGRY
jgi:Ca2+-binding EF-hand superfamily protein